MPADLRRAYLAAAREGAGAFAPAGLEYLYHLVLRLARQGSGFRHVPASRLCRAFRDQAAGDFGKLAPHVLERWGLGSGGDLGRAVFLLAGRKCLSLNEGETLEEYEAAGVFRFS